MRSKRRKAGKKKQAGTGDGVKSVLDLAADFSKECALAQKPEKGLFGVGNWKRPVESDALAVHPDQIPEAIADAKKKDVPTEFTPDGRPIFRTSYQRRRYLRAYGYKDRNCFYN